MIYGALGDIEEYRGMLKGLDVLIDWLEENDPAQLEVGSHPILGDKVFANVMAPTTRPEAEAHYETHQRYHDLQIDVEGREAFKAVSYTHLDVYKRQVQSSAASSISKRSS